jgi:hypothetical protein
LDTKLLINSKIWVSGQSIYFKGNRIKLASLATFIGEEKDINFGATSPKTTNKIVISTISIRIEYKAAFAVKILLPILIAIRAAVVAAAMLAMVLPNNIKISSSRGFFNKLKIILAARVLSCSNFFSWILDNEKKAVSEPEKKADKAKKIINV